MKTLKQLVAERDKLEKEIMEQIVDGECECEDCEPFSLCRYRHDIEIYTYCKNCGQGVWEGELL